jgi:L-amino acid N-acyltransferase YncA
MLLRKEHFEDIELADPFFDSLKTDYAEFEEWFRRKAGELAYVFRGESGLLDGFLYLKPESGPITDVQPMLPAADRLKVGTFKINPHGTRLGERFIKKIFDHAVAEGKEEIYVTIFEKHQALVSLFERYGFDHVARKKTANGEELVMVKVMGKERADLLQQYPLIRLASRSVYLLSLQPQWHTRLLPDSILKSEDASIIEDVSHSNSIHKVYLAAMAEMERLQRGDILLIYRTTDNLGPAHFRSVATSVCVVEDYRSLASFGSKDEFVRYCAPYSIFTPQDLESLWANKRYPHVVRFTYNFALPRRVTHGKMIEDMGFDGQAYWGFMRVTHEQFRTLLGAARLDENLVID